MELWINCLERLRLTRLSVMSLCAFQLISNEGRCEEGHTTTASTGGVDVRPRRRRRRKRRRRRRSYEEEGARGDSSSFEGRPNLHPRNMGNRRARPKNDIHALAAKIWAVKEAERGRQGARAIGSARFSLTFCSATWEGKESYTCVQEKSMARLRELV